ncbi:MAG: hypothetical protein Q8S33_36835 [Myxococcales bacterium]|nr:hypothetical protein [Myxococcales bacterium]
MSLNAAVLHFTGEHDEAERAEELHLELPEAGWSPMRWNREAAANDDVLIEASPSPIIHSTDSGLAWGPGKAG